jgi:hypothetical protein
MARCDGDRSDRVAALAATLLAHVLIVALITPMRSRGPASAPDEVLPVEFVPRRERVSSAPVKAAEPRRSKEPTLDGDEAETSRTRVPLGHANASAPLPSTNASETRQPLDLTVHDPTAHPTTPRDAFARPAPLESKPTRFAQAWVPDGTAIEQTRFRSPAAAVALGLFGGPPRRCTEVERRLRMPDCLPLHGQEADDEALRRSLDP